MFSSMFSSMQMQPFASTNYLLDRIFKNDEKLFDTEYDAVGSSHEAAVPASKRAAFHADRNVYIGLKKGIRAIDVSVTGLASAVLMPVLSLALWAIGDRSGLLATALASTIRLLLVPLCLLRARCNFRTTRALVSDGFRLHVDASLYYGASLLAFVAPALAALACTQFGLAGYQPVFYAIVNVESVLVTVCACVVSVRKYLHMVSQTAVLSTYFGASGAYYDIFAQAMDRGPVGSFFYGSWDPDWCRKMQRTSRAEAAMIWVATEQERRKLDKKMAADARLGKRLRELRGEDMENMKQDQILCQRTEETEQFIRDTERDYPAQKELRSILGKNYAKILQGKNVKK